MKSLSATGTGQRPAQQFSHGRCKSYKSNSRHVVFASPPDSKTPQVNEDMLERLRKAEEEAARLRKQLEVAQAVKGAPAAGVKGTKPPRIDSIDNRETPFIGGKAERSSWLSEADVDFFVGTGVGETSASAAPVDPEAEATIQRRLLIAGLLSAGALALALIPTDALAPKPQKPLYFYLVPLLRIQDLLNECDQIIQDAEWDQLRLVLSRVQGTPNNAQQNLNNVVALLDDSNTRSKAQKLAFEINDYLNDMDYQKYFDAIPVRTISGVQNAEFVKFSSAALKATQTRLSQFLRLVPRDALDAAIQANTI